MFLEKKVPLEARENYRYDSWSGMLGSVSIAFVGPFAAVIAREQLKASAFEIGLLTAAPVIGSLLSIFWAQIMIGKRKLPFVVVPIVLCRIFLLLVILSYSSFSFVMFISLFFFVASVSGPAYSRVMKGIYPDSDRARIMSYVRQNVLIVIIIFTAFAGKLLQIVSYRYVFPIAGIIGMLAAYTFNKLKMEENVNEDNISGKKTNSLNYLIDTLKILKYDKAYRWFTIAMFVFGMGNFIAAPVFSIYQVDVLGVDTRWASYYTVITQIISLFLFPYWGSRIDKKSPIKTFSVCVLFWCLIPLNYYFSISPATLIPSAVISGALLPALELIFISSVLHYAPTNKIVQYQAIFSTALGIRGSIGPFIGAALLQSNLLSMKGIFILVTLIFLSSFFIFVYIIKRFEKNATL
ncbi:MAG: MFS transporter [Armatimonadota bacterium]